MSTVSFSGLATGLDTANIVDQLVEIKRLPIYRLQSRRKGFEAQISALGKFKSKLLALQEAAQKLDTASEFGATKAVSSDEDILKVTTGSDAVPGNYDIVVNTLARAQKSVSQGFDTPLNDVGTGTVSFDVGGTVTTLDISSFTNYEALADRINAEVDGVNASIVFDGSDTGGYHLVLTGEAGTDSAFSVDTSGLSGGVTPAFTQTQAATDATLTVDGMPVTASGNQLEDVISGLTLDLRSADPGTTVHVEVTMDTEGIKEQVSGFVDAYNDFVSYYETATGADGDLEGNPSARSVLNRVENLMIASHDGEAGNFTLLAQIGIERTRDKTLKFDETKFAEALADDFNAVRDLFIEREGNTGKAGLLDDAVEELTDSIDGVFKYGTDALNRKIKNADASIERYERSIDNYRTTLERKFLAMESMVAQLQAQGSYLSSMLMQG